MKLKKLFQVLVVGGAALAGAGCGPAESPPGSSTSAVNPGGGVTASDGGTSSDAGTSSGPNFW